MSELRRLYSEAFHTAFSCICDPAMLCAVGPGPLLCSFGSCCTIVPSDDIWRTRSFFRVAVTVVQSQVQHSMRG